jgi:hypothetical protein
MAQRRDGMRWGRLVVVVVALLIINLPFALHLWTQHRVATDGRPVTATVVGVSQAGDHLDVSFRLPQDVDAGQKLRTVKVDRTVGARAYRTKTLPVRVLSGHPNVFHVDGQVPSRAPLVATLLADALIGVLVVFSWRLGGRIRRPPLVGIAVEDVRPGEEGSLLDRQADGTYLVNGEVASTGPRSLVLTLRDRDVEIQLRDHDNPVAVGDRAQVRAQLVG